MTNLAHESGDDTVEGAALVGHTGLLSCAQSPAGKGGLVRVCKGSAKGLERA